MSRSASRSVRILCVVLGLVMALASQVLQPSRVGATAGLTINKVVCDLTMGATCPTSATTTTVSNATSGDLIQYNLNYTNTSSATSTVTLTDQLQNGQTVASCFGASTPAGATTEPCVYNGALPPTVTITIANVPPGASGTAAIRVTVASSVTNSFVGSVSNPTGTFNTLPSNSTTVTVVGSPPPPTGGSCLFATKQVRDVSLGDIFTTNEFAFHGDLVRYQITVTNSCGTAAGAVTVTDLVQAGQAFSGSSCQPFTCSFNGSFLTFSLGNLAVGSSVTLFFDVSISGCCGQVIPNSATVSSGSVPTSVSNTTTVTVVSGVSPPVVTPPVVFPVGTLQICGVITAFTPAGATAGFMTINGVTFTLLPLLVPTGIPFTSGISVCLTLTLNQFGQVSSVIVAPNVAAVNFVCGIVNGFTPGTAVVVVTGTSFAIAPGTTFPFVPTPGSATCFLMSGGAISGSLSVVPIAATPVEEPSGVHRSGRSLAL